jgi:carbon monoxide dehydrogenase subunit G
MPSISASEEFLVQATIDQCWNIVSDLSSVGSCIPGCESVTSVDSKTANFKVKLRIGYISKTLELKARIEEERAPNHFSFVAEGTDAEISGAIDLSSLNEQTKLMYKIDINPISVTGKTAMAMIGKDLVKRQAEEFASCVKSRLEKK